MTALDDTLDDLSGFAWIPGMDKVLDGIAEARDAAAAGRLSADATQTLLSLLGNPHGPDLVEALALLVQDLTNPTTNPALASLDPDTGKQVQHHGELHAHDTADYTPREHTNEAAGLISEAADATETAGGRCEAMTDAEREELPKKVKEANDRSENRPR